MRNFFDLDDLDADEWEHLLGSLSTLRPRRRWPARA